MTRPDPAKIADPLTRDPETRFHLWFGAHPRSTRVEEGSYISLAVGGSWGNLTFPDSILKFDEF